MRIFDSGSYFNGYGGIASNTWDYSHHTYSRRIVTLNDSPNVLAVVGKQVGLDLVPRGVDVFVELASSGNFSFDYSGNIVRIRLYQAGKLSYDGDPISSFRGIPKVPLRIHLQFQGDATLGVTDECSA